MWALSKRCTGADKLKSGMQLTLCRQKKSYPNRRCLSVSWTCQPGDLFTHGRKRWLGIRAWWPWWFCNCSQWLVQQGHSAIPECGWWEYQLWANWDIDLFNFATGVRAICQVWLPYNKWWRCWKERGEGLGVEYGQAQKAGAILVFLPGMMEIHRLQSRL